jgi:hypothetical protein
MRRPFSHIPPDRRAARVLGSTARPAEPPVRALPTEVHDGRAAGGDGVRPGQGGPFDAEERRPVPRDGLATLLPGGSLGDGAPEPELAPLLVQLRGSLATLVGVLREEGQPIERVIPRVKALVREAARAERWPGPLDVLVARVVRWTIETYYERPARAGASPRH